MRKTEIATLIIKNEVRNFLYITIKIIDKNNYYLFKSDKLDIIFESTNHNLQESKDEFANEIIDLLYNLAKNNELYQLLKHYKFELKPENEVIVDKIKETENFYNNHNTEKEVNFIKLLDGSSKTKIYD